MKWIRRKAAPEWAIDILVPLLFASAAGFAAWAAGLAVAVVAGVVVVAAGIAGAALARAGATAPGRFELVIEAIETVPDDGPDDALLLEDRLDEAQQDSRVVRLFAPETIAAPGELADRIETWLDGARERTAARPALAAGGGGHGPQSSPASAALHAALADIRRSLA